FVEHDQDVITVEALKSDALVRAEADGVIPRPELQLCLVQRWILDPTPVHGAVNLSPQDALDLRPRRCGGDHDAVPIPADPPHAGRRGDKRLSARVARLTRGPRARRDRPKYLGLY